MLLVALASVAIASCYDGDTCRALGGERIRLACIDTPWPDVDRGHLWWAIEEYARRDRRYGGAEPNPLPR